MTDAQNFLETLASEGYSPEEIAEKLTSLGVKFIKEGDNITIIDDGVQKQATQSAGTSVPEEVSPEDEITILSCMSDVVENLCIPGRTRMKEFNRNIKKECAGAIEYICRMVGISQDQAILLSAIIENKGRHRFNRHDLASELGISFIKLLSYESALNGLADKRLINLVGDETISVGAKTIKILASNKPYSPPTYNGLDTAGVLKELHDTVYSCEMDEISLNTMVRDIDEILSSNPETGFVKAAAAHGVLDQHKCGITDRAIFYVLVEKYIYDSDDRVCWGDFDQIIDNAALLGRIHSDYNRCSLPLQELGVIEPVLEDGMASPDAFHIKNEVKAELFAEVGGVRETSRATQLKITRPADITPRELYYNPAEGEQMRRLASLLDQQNYKATCDRLKSSGMRTGFTCLFYGGPGTGKTESVYQLAKATGRGIIPINVSEIKSCWVGESEKLIQGVFDRYNALTRDCEVAPILLFNEADAIFGIRREGAEMAVDKMENAIQNIILQEMEKLQGILIATTNLTQNLDKAFERRFLYKVRFEKPGLEAKKKIWKYMIPDLKEEEARELAEGYDFSGGQIENISRKKMITTILDGKSPSFPEVRTYCDEELIAGRGGEGRRIGF